MAAPADNRSAILNGAYLTAYVDHLHGLGIVRDVTHPAFEFELPGAAGRTAVVAHRPVLTNFPALSQRLRRHNRGSEGP